MGIEDKLAKAAELEQLAAKLRAEVEAERVKKWMPKKGLFHIALNDHESIREFGAARDNFDQSVKDMKRMRQFNRLLCWLVEQGWDGELHPYKDDEGDICLCFDYSHRFSRDLMYGIANGVIEL